MGKTVITITFDDGLDSHLDIAAPILDEFGFKGTFFVQIAADSLGRRADDWRRIAANGHELGNHTVFHPAVSHKDWVSEGNALESYTLDRMKMELDTANNVLRILDGKAERTFSYPCGNSRIGHGGRVSAFLKFLGLDRTRIAGWAGEIGFDPGATFKDYSGIVRDRFVAARAGELQPFDDRRNYSDRYRIPSISGDGLSAAQLLDSVDEAVETGGWTVYSFHGIDGGHGLYCSREAFRAMVRRLSEHDNITVQPFIEGARLSLT